MIHPLSNYDVIISLRLYTNHQHEYLIRQLSPYGKMICYSFEKKGFFKLWLTNGCAKNSLLNGRMLASIDDCD